MLKSKRDRRPNRGTTRGMTLTEIMIVLAIISMIMGAAGFVGISRLKDAKKKQTLITMKQVEGAITQWQADTNENCPQTLDELVSGKVKIMNKPPRDGWNNPFAFKCPGEHNNDVDLMSRGPDGKEGTEDDINNWTEETKKP